MTDLQTGCHYFYPDWPCTFQSQSGLPFSDNPHSTNKHRWYLTTPTISVKVLGQAPLMLVQMWAMQLTIQAYVLSKQRLLTLCVKIPVKRRSFIPLLADYWELMIHPISRHSGKAKAYKQTHMCKPSFRPPRRPTWQNSFAWVWYRSMWHRCPSEFTVSAAPPSIRYLPQSLIDTIQSIPMDQLSDCSKPFIH